MHRCRITLSIVLTLIGAGCAPDTRPTTAPQPSGDAQERTAHPASAARNLAKDATSELAPTPPKDPNLTISQAYMNGALKKWFGRVAPKIETAQEEYRRLVSETSDESVVDYSLESTQLLLFVPRQLAKVQDAALPVEWREDEKLRARFIANLRVLAAPFYRVAARSVVECVQLGSDRGVEKKALETCGQLADEISKAIGATPPEKEEVREVAFAEFTDTSQTLPNCAYSGGVNDLNHRLAPNDGGKALGRLRGARFERFALKATSENHHTVSLSWPLIGEFQLQGTPTLLTKQKLEFLPGHLWHPPYAPVDASKTAADRAQIRLVLPGQQEALSQEVKCDDLVLTSSANPTFRNGIPFMTKSASLFATEESPAIATVGGPLAGLEILKKGSDRSLVRSESNPFVMFEGWISNSAMAARPRTGVTSARPLTIQGTHQTRKGSQIFLDEKLPLNVAAGVPLVIVQEKEDRVEVHLAGFIPRPGSALFINKEHLETVSMTPQ